MREVDVEDLAIWTYRDCLAHRIEASAGLFEIEREADGQRIQRRSADGCARIADIGALGCSIVGAGMAAGTLHPDAQRVHEAVKRLPDPGLIIRYAHTGLRPEWRAPELRLEPVWKRDPRFDERGLPARRSFVVEYDRYRKASSCPVRITGRPEIGEARRANYADWHASLTLLCDELRYESLRDHRIISLRAPARPWVVEKLPLGCGDRETENPPRLIRMPERV